MKRIFVIGIPTLVITSLTMLSVSIGERQGLSERVADSLRVVNFEPSVLDSTDLSAFRLDSKNYCLTASLEDTWDAYRHISPAKAWQGPINSLIIIEAGGKFNSADKFEEGSVVLVRIRLFKNKSFKALFEISKIDDEKHIIELKYGKQNVTSGFQRISFTSENEMTIIKHMAFYKSKSWFRDKFYPRFHHKCIDEFHARVQSLILELAEK